MMMKFTMNIFFVIQARFTFMFLVYDQGRKQVANFGGAWKDENSNFKGEIFHSTSKSTVPTKLIFLNSPNNIVLFSL